MESKLYGCLICTKPTKKYKCSKCLEFCCSYECYKAHKVNSLCLEKIDDDSWPNCVPEEAEPTQHEFKSYDTVPPDKIARLKTAEGVKQKLYNPHLRNLLRRLDTDPRPWTAIQNAMQEPLFVEFADECLKVVELENSNE